MGLSVGLSMPVLNESSTIKSVLTEIRIELRQIDYTICIMDDGSTDGTLDIINNLSNDHIKLIQGKKKHYGCQRGRASRLALEWLLANTKHTIFVEIDADGAQRPAELLKGINHIANQDGDIAIASKYLPVSQVIGRTFFRKAVSLVYSMLARMLIGAGIKDYSNSYRFYNRRAAEFLLKFKPGYTSPVYLLEILVCWFANHYKIIEIPYLIQI